MKDLCFGLHHVGIYTHDLKASEAFYRDIFGFEILYHIDGGEEGEPDITFIAKDGLQIELVQPKEEALRAAAQAMNCLNHIAIACSDTRAAVTVLKEKGVSLETEAAQYVRDFGAPGQDIDIIFLRGPAGERIELYQELSAGSGDVQ